MAIFSTLFSYFWDMKVDWGFINLSKRIFLKEEKYLKFEYKKYYYGAAILNLLLRFSWSLSLSEEAIYKLGIGPELFIFLICYVELFRRCIWNFFRVEHEYVEKVNKMYIEI